MKREVQRLKKGEDGEDKSKKIMTFQGLTLAKLSSVLQQ